MAKFGQYETGRPLYRTGFSAIYLGQSGAKTPRRRAVKAYRPSVRVRDEKLSAAQSAAFLDSADVQRKAAGADARYWAPIHESGAAPEGMFYVTDCYDLSAQQLIDGRVNLGAAGLCRIVESVGRGLLTLKRACGRPHGNLKFTNILIARRKGFRREQIVLADPCPGSQLDVDTHAKMDLKQLGALIHQLVMHRNPPLIAGYQAPDSQEWQRLGRRADAWRAVCNRLLAMDVEAGPIALEELVAGLPGVAHRGWRRLFNVAVCLCVVALLVVLYRPVGDLVKDRLWPTTPEEARLAYLGCAEARDWLPELWRKLDPGVGKQRYASWKEGDKSLVRLVACVETYGEPFEKSRDGLVIPEAPDEEELAGNRQYRKEIREANEARLEIEAFLFGAARGWSLPKELAGRAAGLREAKCASMADYMDTVLGSIAPQERLAECIDEVLYLKTNWYTVTYVELEPDAVAGDAGLSAPVRDAADFVARLKRLPTYYRKDAGEWFEIWRAEAQDPNGIGSSAALRTAYLKRLDNDREIGPDRAAFAGRWKEQWGKLRELKGRVEAMRTNLLRLDHRLPQTMVPDPDSRPWAETIRTYYQETKRDDLIAEVAVALASQEPFPDPNHYPEACRRLLNWSADATALTTDFAVIESRVMAWYGLGEAPAGPAVHDGRTIESLYGIWQGADLLKELAAISTPLGELVGRVERLRRIQELDTANGLVEMALPSPPEAVHAIWLRLEAVDPNWPSNAEQWEQEQGIEKAVERELANLSPGGLADSGRIAFLEQGFRRTQEKRERTFRLAEIAAYTDTVRANAETDRMLEKLAGQTLPLDDSLADLMVYREAVRGLAEFVAGPDWPDGYDRATFYRLDPNEQGRRFPPDGSVTPAVIRDWLAALDPAYRILPETVPDGPDGWDARANRLREEIAKGLEEALAAKDERGKADLEGDRAELDRLAARFDGVRKPPIEKYRVAFEEREKLWGIDLPRLESGVKDHVRPGYCVRLRRSEQGAVVFGNGLNPDVFEPVRYRDGRADPVTLGHLRDFEADLVLKTDFFERTAGTSPVEERNVGWPKYIRAIRDPSVILRFVPQDDAGDPPPFYLAIREITNEQYRTFLHRAGAAAEFASLVKGPARYAKWYLYPPALRAGLDFDPNETHRASHPVVWVTHGGAARYADWLGAQLPEASWQRRAVAYSGGPLAMDPAYYHVRGPTWLAAAEQYNTFCKTIRETDGASLTDVKGVTAPLGAIREGADRVAAWVPLDMSGMFPDPVAYAADASAWPRESHTVGDLKLHDLVGNVWEWCKETSSAVPSADVFGRSCLSRVDCLPTDFVKPFDRTESACDLGFRVAVACP